MAPALIALTACSRGPSARPAAGTAERASSERGASSATPQVITADLTDCESPRALLGRLRTLTVSVTRAVPFDSTGVNSGDLRPACRVQAAGHYADSTRSDFDSLLSWLEQAGWHQAGYQYQADGPDGSTTGRHRDGVTCIVSGMWDGGDDTDTTYVPSDTLTVAATCAKTAAEDTTAPW